MTSSQQSLHLLATQNKNHKPTYHSSEQNVADVTVRSPIQMLMKRVSSAGGIVQTCRTEGFVLETNTSRDSRLLES